jgi:uncharacterized protein
MNMKTESYRRKTALVTGASGGIGKEMAKVLAREKGIHLILTARRKERLEELKGELEETGVSIEVFPADLSRREELDSLVEYLKNRSGGPVDYLINNAGFGLQGPYLEIEEETEGAMIQLNLVALTRLSRAVLPPMRERGFGAILNLSSIAAFFPGPYMTSYYATKAYILSYSEGLAEEFRGSGVTVTALCPGPTRTDFEKRAGMEGKGLFSGRIPEAAAVARYGIEAMLKGRVVAVPGLFNKFTAFFGSRLAPRALIRRMTAKIQNFS